MVTSPNQVKAYGKQVFIRQDPEPFTSKGVILAEGTQRRKMRPLQGIVLSVGPRADRGIEKGLVAVFARGGGARVSINGDDSFIFFKDEDIQGVYPPEGRCTHNKITVDTFPPRCGECGLVFQPDEVATAEKVSKR